MKTNATEMDYKKEYEAMVQRARELHEGGDALTKQQMEIVCPGLAESEDERIRKELMCHIQGEIDTYDNMVSGDYDSRDKEDKKVHSMLKRAIAYLEKQKINTEGDFARGYDCGYECCLNSHGAEWFEKQKEQKPAEKQDYSGLTDFERAIHRGFLRAGVENVPVEIIKETAQKCLAHLPSEWSEEDRKMLNTIISDGSRGVEFDAKQVNFLKSLCPQSHWKPREEQPEVDLEKEIANMEFMGSNDARDIRRVALRFYQLGLNARKEE